jgi:propionyl-CoA synthetase
MKSLVVVKLPLPPGNVRIWEKKHVSKPVISANLTAYYYLAMGYKDEDGYIFITGRTDDVGTSIIKLQMEEVASHHSVAECAVIGIQDELKGQIPLALVTKSGDEIEQYQLNKK